MGLACDEVLTRLVAWQDGELSPGEATQVGEHLAGCPTCTRAERRLAASLPVPPAVPIAVRARLASAFDIDTILAAADAPEPAPPAPAPWRAVVWGWMARPSPVPLGAVLAYLALLAATFGWGASNWWALRADAPHGLGGPAIAAPTDARGSAIPADQFRPAAYDPASDGAAPPAPRADRVPSAVE